MNDNFDLISSLLKFDNSHEFYFLQIILRGKDSGETGNRLIKHYSIYSVEQLLELKDEIVKLCEMFKARAYIHLTRRDDHQIALAMIAELAERLGSGNTSHLNRLHSTACGRHHSKIDKTWVVDIDNKEDKVLDDVHALIYGLDPVGQKGVAVVPTKSGIHLITRPFNVKMFHDHYPKIEVHKNNPTVLYVP